VPQPQDAVAFGLTTRNEAPIRSSTKSTSEPARNGTEAGSTSTTAPVARDHQIVLGLGVFDVEFVLEAGAAAALDEMRSMAPSPSVLRISPMRRAARSLTVMAVVMAWSPEGVIPNSFGMGRPDIVKCVISRNQMDKD
jgi:hypothetical protein